MKLATRAQRSKVLDLITQKQVPASQLQDLLESGLLADLLYANVASVNRVEFRRILGLKDAPVIDCDAAPILLHKDWKIEEHKPGGQLIWDRTNLRLYLSENQHDGQYVRGDRLRKELADKPVLNANVLDYLLDHPHLIPEEWKNKVEDEPLHIFFWGTIYRYANDIFVRYLHFETENDCWSWASYDLEYLWQAHDPTVMLAS